MTLNQWVKTDHGPIFNRLKPLTFMFVLPVAVVFGAFRVLLEDNFFPEVASVAGRMGKAVWTGNNGDWE